MPPEALEPTNSAGERLQTYALDRTASGLGLLMELLDEKQQALYVTYIHTKVSQVSLSPNDFTAADLKSPVRV